MACGAPQAGSQCNPSRHGHLLARTNPKDPYDYKALVTDKYLDKKNSGLEFEVVPLSEPGRYDIRLESIGAKKK